MSKARTPSPRAKRCWQRLQEWYGTRLAEHYGEEPPPDWCEVVDRCDNEQVKKGLSAIRKTFLQHPPTLPQFEAAMRPPYSAATGPNPAEILCRAVLRRIEKRLTTPQMRGPWTYLHRKDGSISGVVIDPDGASIGHRIMVEDLSGDLSTIGAPDWLQLTAAHAAKVT